MAAKKRAVNRELINRRVAFVKANPNLSPAEARKRFFVQTRAKELRAAGKEVNRAALRKQFESGKVKRQEFYTATDLKRSSGGRSNPKVDDDSDRNKRQRRQVWAESDADRSRRQRRQPWGGVYGNP